MVKIRYSELPVGLHVTVQVVGHSKIIYLLPGLTAGQRRAALARARSSGRMGQGPVLPTAAMARAVSADKIRTTSGNLAAAMRGHPMLLLPPLIVVVSGVIVFLLMSFVQLTVRGDDPPALHGAASTGPPHGPHHRPPIGAINPTLPMYGGGSSTSAPAPATPAATPSPAGSTPILTSGPSPSPTSGSTSPAPSPSLAPSPTPSPSSSGTCIKLGPLGLCVNI